MHHHQRSRHRSIERHRLERGALVVEHDLLLLDRQPELHDFGALFGGLLVRVHEGRGEEIDALPRYFRLIGKGGGCEHKGYSGGAEHDGSAGQHLIIPLQVLRRHTSSADRRTVVCAATSFSTTALPRNYVVWWI